MKYDELSGILQLLYRKRKGAIIQLTGLIVIIISFVSIWYLTSQSFYEEKNIVIRSDYSISARNDFEFIRKAIFAVAANDYEKLAELNMKIKGNENSDIEIKSKKVGNIYNITVSVSQPIIGLRTSSSFETCTPTTSCADNNVRCANNIKVACDPGQICQNNVCCYPAGGTSQPCCPGLSWDEQGGICRD